MPEIIESVSVTPIPSNYQKELGKNTYIDNIGTQRLEWVIRARSTSGAERISIANRLMREGTAESMLPHIKGALLGREVGQLLEISDGVVTGEGSGMDRWYRRRFDIRSRAISGNWHVFEDGKYAVPSSPGLAVSIDHDLYSRVYGQHETVIS
ncbi:MAG TPA: hypothetical protein QF694_03210 [Dehalococcoidia bacterium]|jgi:hypothetical protein|nr:hypothetical protein [Dehalococcoidia bacterium]MDP7090005.1 hypothetical protein [Dehalococcoidia bacterium]MDP7262295.1 hypothetical protein [Dehalococcoidia bacterium]MDP7484521.1 hypothetical protein [Dehalococcoidia bacterium]HJP27800.1 hypothetical protein [Dehalococcoidia bacterium]|tara:strand:+ start:1994 stop:2452 length:459 start_codon:yes stop_codon:yes gene_type:complete